MRNAKFSLRALLLLIALACGMRMAVASEQMEFRIASTGGTGMEEWIVAEGLIDSDTPRRFRDFVASVGIIPGGGYPVYLHSEGGSLIGGIELGEIIREMGFATKVARSVPIDTRYSGLDRFEMDAPGECFSACAFAFLGGTSRSATDKSIGVHQYYTEQMIKEPEAMKYTSRDISEQQVINGLLVNFIVKMGVDARFIYFASQTSPDKIYRFSRSEMDQFDILRDEKTYSPWVLEPYKGGLISVSRSKAGARVATLFCRGDGHLRLLINLPFSGNVADLRNNIDGAGVFLFGNDISSTDIEGRVQGERAILDFKLPIQMKESKSEGMGAFGATRFLFYHDLPRTNFDVMARLVRKNCF